jgi:hypothetical protein
LSANTCHCRLRGGFVFCTILFSFFSELVLLGYSLTHCTDAFHHSVIKFVLFIYCIPLRKSSSQVEVLWEDHRNDLWINTFGEYFPPYNQIFSFRLCLCFHFLSPYSTRLLSFLFLSHKPPYLFSFVFSFLAWLHISTYLPRVSLCSICTHWSTVSTCASAPHFFWELSPDPDPWDGIR